MANKLGSRRHCASGNSKAAKVMVILLAGLAASSYDSETGNATTQVKPSTVVAGPQFIQHVVDSQLYSLGADMGDANNHGPADLIASDAQGIYWYGDGGKHVIDEFNTPTLFIHLRTTDIDHDGDIDAVAVDHRNGNLFYYENPGRGPAKAGPWPRHLVDDKVVGAHAVAIADIDRDGRIDIVASVEAEATPPVSVFWYACPENPNQAARWPKYTLGPGRGGGLAHYPGIGDVNGDGRLDVVHAAKQGEWYRMWLQPEDPTQPWIFKEIGTG